MSEVREFACPMCGTRIERATQQASVYEICPVVDPKNWTTD
jgi:predicted RNA-binding Zn-ribbon protein involved in translation (DUF1610 family)